MRCSFVLALVALAVSGCASHEKPKETGLVSWTAVVSLVRHCKAKRVDQTHSRLITIKLRDGRKAFEYEPRIDAIVPLLNHANASCGPITFATE